MPFKYIILLLLMLSLETIIAQPITTQTREMMIQTGVDCADNGDYVNAVEWFNKAYKEQKDNDLLVAIGDMYMLLRDYEKAEKYYERVLRRDKRDDYFDIRIDYARSLKQQGKYKEAIEELTAFVSATEDENLRIEGRSELKGMLLMEKYPENMEAAISFGGGINSGSAETSPVFFEDGSLYYSGLNTDKPIVIDGEEGEYHAKIFTASREAGNKFGSGTALEEAINRVGFYNTGISFSPDGQRMYFTRQKMKTNKLETSQLYISNRVENRWVPPFPVEDFELDVKLEHPAEGVLFGRKVLYFVSDMPGGYGGKDIYYAPMEGDVFGVPVNLGPAINTPKDEVSPFYRDGVLYFSSTGHPGMGGLDIFKTQWDGSQWSTPENMGLNYNTTYDDLFLRFNASGNAGVLVSNRKDKDKAKFKNNETCCDDIYLIQIRDIIINLTVSVSDQNNQPLDGGSLELFEAGKMELLDTKSNPLGSDISVMLDSNIDYVAIITRPGYKPDTLTFNTNGLFDDYTFKKTVNLVTKPVETRTITRNQPIVLQSIYFDYDDDTILPDAEPSLKYLKTLMEKYADLRIELSSHTDSRGRDEYNKKLSQRRADSTKAWLVEEGISGGRIKAVGYGETQLLNKCGNNVQCEEEEHRLNRRSEFKIISGPQTIEIEVEQK